MSKIFFIDFDGTITKQDTCYGMVKTFAGEGWQELNRQWENKELSTQECARRTFELFTATPEIIAQFLNHIEIDDYFQEFVELCQKRGYKIYILSDGYDFNIKHILGRYGLDLPFYANQLLYAGGFSIKSPYVNPDCGQCGTCKTTLMEQLREPGCQTVYIGDGYSDTCSAMQADVVFAKGTLLKFCRAKERAVFPFTDFSDIMARLGCGQT